MEVQIRVPSEEGIMERWHFHGPEHFDRWRGGERWKN